MGPCEAEGPSTRIQSHPMTRQLCKDPVSLEGLLNGALNPDTPEAPARLLPVKQEMHPEVSVLRQPQRALACPPCSGQMTFTGHPKVGIHGLSSSLPGQPRTHTKHQPCQPRTVLYSL